MTRDEAVARVQRLLGFRSDKSTEIVDALKDAQAELERERVLPWFLVSEITSASTTSGEERIAVPAGFLREYEPSALYVMDDETGDFVELAKAQADYLRAAYPGKGRPVAYALVGSYFRLFPTPDAAYTLKIIFYKADTVLSSNVENAWLREAPKLLYARAGVEIAAALRDPSAVKIFQTMAAQEYQRVFADTVAREQANQAFVMGGPD